MNVSIKSKVVNKQNVLLAGDILPPCGSHSLERDVERLASVGIL